METPNQEDSAHARRSGFPQHRDVRLSQHRGDRRSLGLAVKTIYNWISLGRLGPREGICHVGRKVVIHWPTFEAAVMRRGVNGAA